MNCRRLILFGLTFLFVSCASGTGSIAQLKNVAVDLEDEKIDGSFDKAMQNYQALLDKTPASGSTPDSILRSADAKFKKEHERLESEIAGKKVVQPSQAKLTKPDAIKEAISDFEKRTTASGESKAVPAIKVMPGDASAPQSAAMREVISLYRKLLTEYPKYELNDHALYQLARIYEEMGNAAETVKMLDRLALSYPQSRYFEEAQFRRGEYYYAHKKFTDAQVAFKAIVNVGSRSSYYELVLYKLGWTHFKLDAYEESVHQFVKLLDHMLAKGYDLERPKDSFDGKRIEDTYRAMSLGLSGLGGADAVAAYFSKFGARVYEASVYRSLGEYYLEKRRYIDAAETYKAFVRSNPNLKISPSFSVLAIDSYKKGGFSKLFIEANNEFVTHYGVKSPYWKRFKVTPTDEVYRHIQISLKELISYHHAQYQDKRFVIDKDKNFQEAVKWYREFISWFPKDAGTPALHYQLAELLHENQWHSQSALEYEHVAYDYPAHEKTVIAGYAAIIALRENLAMAEQDKKNTVRREVVRSSLKFADTFPKNEKAALVLSAAIEDIYELKEYAFAAATARKLLALYATDKATRRAAWLIYAHSSFELGIFKDAEEGYLTALGLTDQKDSARAGWIENLAASLYKQGERANNQKDFRLAATYFFLVGTNAPTAKLRPIADYDGVIALIQIKAWEAAASAADSYRTNFPGHPKQLELAQKLAFAYKEAGKLLLAADEYERIGTETKDLAVRREAWAIAGDLYFQIKEMDKADSIYRRYLIYFPKPLEYALELRYRSAMHLKTQENMEYFDELKQIRDVEALAGAERTSRTRFLGATAAIELADLMVKQFAEIKLVKPIDQNLVKKKAAMKSANEQLEKLFDYEMDEATSAATYYLAEMYYNFSRILVDSERPDDLKPLEKEQYELSIEEQVYPFEEKSIEIHQKNMELLSRGMYNSIFFW